MNMVRALPEGLIQRLDQILRPEGLTEIPTERILRFFLDEFNAPYQEWGTEKYPLSKSVDVLLKEFHDRECRLFLIEHEKQHYILRDIQTSTLYVKVQIPEPTERNPNFKRVLRLREYHLVNGVRVFRRYPNSMSEKLTNGESHRDAAIRAIRQELRIRPRKEFLEFPHFLSMSEYPQVQREADIEGTDLIPTEPDTRWADRYPGLIKRNKLDHFIWHMPLEYYRPEGYHEPKTNHYFEWVDPTKKNDGDVVL